MDPKLIQQWTLISELLDAALDLPKPEREKWFRELDPRYDEIKPALRELLSNQERLEESSLLTPSGMAVQPLSPDFVGGDAETGTLKSGQLIGAYRLQKEIGRGGMANVWLAERADGTFARQVALKLPHINYARRDLIARFTRERNILASLEHPNIARLYDAGVSENGIPYLAMEYVEGKPISQYARERNLDVPARLHLFLQVLDAVQFAHERLVIHRDLKPSNILVSNQGEVRLLDFGIAKLLGQDQVTNETELTQSVGRALTLDYASPEQVRGESLTTASDVYSLGVILYELLTGTRPYQLKITTPAQLEQAIVDSDPTTPSARILLEANKNARDDAKRRAKILAGDLDTITMKALQKRTAARYTTAAELSLELKRHLAFEPIQAKRESGWYGFKKFVRRNRVPVAGSVALVASLTTGLVGTLWQAGRAEQAAVLARNEAQRASAEASAREREAVRANAAAAEAILQSKNAQEATQRTTEALGAAEEARVRESRAAQIAQAAERGAKTSAMEANKQRDEANKQSALAKSEAQHAAAINEFLSETFLSNAIYQADAGASQQRRAVDLLNDAAQKIQTRLLDQPAARNRLLYQFAEIFNGHGDFGRAESLAKLLLDANQQDGTPVQRKERYNAGLLLAHVYNGTRRYEEQLKVVKLIEPYVSEVETINPESVPNYYYIKGLALIETGNPAGLKDLEAGVDGSRRFAKDSPFRRNEYTVGAGRLAGVYMRAGRYKDADAVLREAIEFFTPYIDSSPAVYAFLHTIKARNHATAGHFAASEKAQAISRKYYQRVNLPDNAGWRLVNAAQSRIESALGNWQASETMAADALDRYPERDRGLDAYTIERIGLGLARARGGEWIKHCDAMNAVFKEVDAKPVHRFALRELAAYVVARCASPALTASQHDFARSLVIQLDALKDNMAASPNPIESIPRNVALAAVDLLDAKPQAAYDRLSAFLATRAASAYKSHPMWFDVVPWLGIAASNLGKHSECVAVTQSALAEIEADEEIKQSRPLFVPILQTLAQCQMKAGDRAAAVKTIERAIRLQEQIESPAGQSLQYSKGIMAVVAAYKP
jgi:serine/threonine protein kinase